MKKLIPILLLISLTLTGCSERPLQSGEIEVVTLGDKPVMKAGEIGSWTSKSFTKGKIEIYESWAVVIEPDGIKHVAPLDRFGVIRFK